MKKILVLMFAFVALAAWSQDSSSTGGLTKASGDLRYCKLDGTNNMAASLTLFVSATDPTSPTPVEGDIYYNSATDKIKAYTGSTWVEIASGSLAYLPLTGGTLTGTVRSRQIYPDASSTYTSGTSSHSWAAVWTDAIQCAPTGTLAIGNSGIEELNYTPNTSTFTRGGNRVWDAGNDGTGSGLDADTVDGSHAASFLTAETDPRLPAHSTAGNLLTSNGSAWTSAAPTFLPLAGGTMSGNVTMGSAYSVQWTTAGQLAALGNTSLTFSETAGGSNSLMGTDQFYVKCAAPGCSTPVATSLGAGGLYYFYNAGEVTEKTGTFAFPATLSGDRTWTLTDASGTVWTSGNDGTGSGLDADTVDGSHAAAFAPSAAGVPTPANPGDDGKFLKAQTGAFSWQSVPADGDSVIGNEIVNVTGTTLTRSGTGTGVDPYTLGLNLANANTWTGLQRNTADGEQVAAIVSALRTRSYDAHATVSTTITAALAAIVDASPTKRYALHVPAGTYTEQVQAKNYVDLIGADRATTILASTSQAADTLLMGGVECTVQNMTIRHTTASGETQKYPIHADTTSTSTMPRGTTYGAVINCTVEALGVDAKSGAGVGLWPGQRFYLIDSSFSSANTGAAQAGIYAHNSVAGDNVCELYIINCTATSNGYGLLFQNIGSGRPDWLGIVGGSYSGAVNSIAVTNSGAGAGETYCYISTATTAPSISLVDATKRLTSLLIATVPSKNTNQAPVWGTPWADATALYLSDLTQKTWGVKSGEIYPISADSLVYVNKNKTAFCGAYGSDGVSLYANSVPAFYSAGTTSTLPLPTTAPTLTESSRYHADDPRPAGWPRSAVNAADNEWTGTTLGGFAWKAGSPTNVSVNTTDVAGTGGGKYPGMLYADNAGADKTVDTLTKTVSWDADFDFAAQVGLQWNANSGLCVLDTDGTGYAIRAYQAAHYWYLTWGAVTTWTTFGATVNHDVYGLGGGIYFRIRRATGTVYVYYSLDGMNWNQIGSNADASTFVNAGYAVTLSPLASPAIPSSFTSDWFRVAIP